MIHQTERLSCTSFLTALLTFDYLFFRLIIKDTKEDYDSMKVCLEKANALRSVLQEKEKLSLDLDKIAGRLEDELKSI